MSISQQLTFNGAKCEYVGRLQKLGEYAYGNALGIFNVATGAFEDGCSVSSEASENHGSFTVAFKAVAPTARSDVAMTAARSLAANVAAYNTAVTSVKSGACGIKQQDSADEHDALHPSTKTKLVMI